MISKQPEIRIKSVNGGWEVIKVKELSMKTVGGGTPRTSIKEYWNGDVPWFRSSNLENHKVLGINSKEKITNEAIKNSAAHIIPADSIAVVTRVGLGKVGLIEYEYSTSQDFLSFVDLKADKFFMTYLLYLLMQRESHISQGTSIKGITNRDLLNKKVTVPNCIEEQAKIGKFFKELDELIELQQLTIKNLKEMKKGFLQRLFLLTDEVYPRIRFKGYFEKWLHTELSFIVEDLSGNDGRTELPILTISAARGWLTQQERFSQVIAGSELKKYTLLKRGELSYNKGNSKTAEFGVVYRLNNFDAALVPRVYHSFKPINKSDSYFIEKLFESKKPDKELRKIVTSGARRDGLLNINKKNFYGINIVVPSPEEQEKIGNFFKQLDELIELEEQELESLQVMKKGFLQKMFV